MAKKKKKGEAWKSVMMDSAGIAVGALGTGLLAKGVKKVMPNASDKIIAIAPVAVGIYLAKTQDGFAKYVGYGLIGSGAATALKAFGIGGVPISQGEDSDIDEVLSVLEAQQEAMDEGEEYAIEDSPIEGATEYDEVGLAA